MEPMNTARGDDATGGRNHPSVVGQEPGLKQRRSDRREDGGLFGGYQGPERRSGDDRRENRLTQ